jgi:hypothetical protein
MEGKKSTLLLTAALPPCASLAGRAAPFLPTIAETWPLIVDCDDSCAAGRPEDRERPWAAREESHRLFGQRVLPLRRSGVPVLSGFFGRSTRGWLTTLGRGELGHLRSAGRALLGADW